jgi:NitT/TauT family transport system substrate-binding protein
MPGRHLATVALAVALSLVATLAAAADKVSVAALAFVSSAPIFIAKERGYFAAEGLDVELKFFEAAQPVALAVVSGDADFGITGLTGGFYNLAAKGALKIIASQSREEPGFDFVAYVVSDKAWDAGFRTVAQFPGHVVAITQVGSTFHYNLGKLAEKRGFKLEALTLKPLQSIPNVVAALQGNQVDAALLPTNIALGLEKQSAGHIIGYVWQETPWQLGALFTSTKLDAGRHDLVQRFVRAYQKATADYAAAFQQRDDQGKRVFGAKADALVPIIQKYVKPAPTAEQVLASVSFIDPEGRLKVQDIYDQVAWYKKMGMVDASADVRSMLDLSYIPGHFDVPAN